MAKLEEVEEEEVKAKAKAEIKKVPDADSATGAVRSGDSGGGGGSEDGEGDSELDADGFETASEGRHGEGSDGEEDYGFSDVEEEMVGRLGVQDHDDEGIARRTQRSADGGGGGGGEGRGGEGAGGKEAEEQPAVIVEQQKQRLQQGIEDAMRAKAEGNSLFAQGEYDAAIAAYQRGLISCPPALLPKKKEAARPQEKEREVGDVVEEGEVGDVVEKGEVVEEVEEEEEEEEDEAVKEIREIRAVLHSNRAACFSHRQMYTEAVEESSKALELNPNYVKALIRRAQAREKLELYEDAIVDVKKVLELDPGNSSARASLRTLVPLAEEKREKLKTEMLAKLKEAGNSILGRFGMSVDNFKTVQDPNTGSYSIQFQR